MAPVENECDTPALVDVPLVWATAVKVHRLAPAAFLSPCIFLSNFPGRFAFPVYLSQVPSVGLSLNLFLHPLSHAHTRTPNPAPLPLSLGTGPFIFSLGDLRCRCRKCLSAQAAAAEPRGFDKPHLIGRKPGEFERPETSMKLLLSGII